MQFELKNRGKDYGVEHLLAPKTGTCLKVLAETISISAEKLQFLFKMGSIYVNEHRLLLEELTVKKGDYFRLHLQPRRFPVENFLWPQSLIFENEDFLVINKPSGLPVHPTVDNIQENLLALLEQKYERELFVTHRLDVPTSGLILYAKTKEYQRFFNQLLADGKVKKLYRCLVHGDYQGPRELIHYMEPSPRAPKLLHSQPGPQYQQCRLKVMDSNSTVSHHTELMIELQTGRTHQIRAQMSFEGFPIVGDRLYGSTVDLDSLGSEKIALQASFLSFPKGLNPGSTDEFFFKLPTSPWQTGISTH